MIRVRRRAARPEAARAARFRRLSRTAPGPLPAGAHATARPDSALESLPLMGVRTALIVDDFAVFRCGVRALLSGCSSLRTVEAGSLHEALGVIASDPPQLVLLDATLPDCTVIQAVAAIRRAAAAATIVLVTDEGELHAEVPDLERLGVAAAVDRSIQPAALAHGLAALVGLAWLARAPAVRTLRAAAPA